MPVDVLDRSALLGVQAFFVLTMTFGGAKYYLSTDTFTIATDDGEEIGVLDGIDYVDWSAALNLFGDSPTAVSIPFSVVVPDLDIGDLISRGHDLSAAVGELARWLEGTTWESRQVLVKGEISEPSHGAPNEPVSFSLTSTPFADRSSMISALAVIDPTSWPSADDAALGNTYPEVFGAPGRFEDSNKVAGSPGYVVHTTSRYLLIAGHEVRSSSVWVRNISNGTDWAFMPVSHVQDGRGVTVAVATLGSGSGDGQYDATATAGDTYVVSWPSDGARHNPRRDGTLERAGDLLDFLLDRTTLRVDQGRTAAASVHLNRFKVAGYYDEAVSGWEWLKGNLLPLLPVSIVAGPDGLYPIVWPHEATANDAIEWLDIDRLDAERVSEVQYAPVAPAANDIRIAYGLDLDEESHAQQVRATGDPDLVASDARLFSTAHLRASWGRYGQAVHSLETDIVYETATASRIASWMSYARAVTTRTVSYVVPPRYRFLGIGDVVVVTDSEISWRDQVCWVEAVKDLDDDELELALRTIEAPGQTARTADEDLGVQAPVAASPPVLTGLGWVGDDFTTTDGTWTGAGLSFTYQFTLDGVDISGATSSTYEAENTGVLRCEVTATNSAGSATQTSNPLVVVDPDAVITQLGATVQTQSGATVIYGRH